MEGCGDRFCLEIYKQKWKQHIHALRHILNTGKFDQIIASQGCGVNFNYVHEHDNNSIHSN